MLRKVKSVCTSALVTLLALCFTFPVLAGDTGIYFDPNRDGEGIVLNRAGERVQFYFFTYEDADDCWNITIPESGLVTSDNCHETRWFLNSPATLSPDGLEASGYLYGVVGLNYPEG